MTQTSAIADTWRQFTARNKVLEFVDMCLRGASQVMLQNNALTGLLIFVGIGVGSWIAGAPRLIGGAIVGTAAGTVTAMLLRANGGEIRQGLFGFSPLLTGIAMVLFLRGDGLVWLLVIFGAAATTMVTIALTTVLRSWGLKPLTFPFVLASWALLMGAYQLAALRVVVPSHPALPGTKSLAPASPRGDVIPGMIEGVAQVFLVSSAVGGAIILIALAVHSVRVALFALAGTVIASLVAIWYQVGASDVEAGLWGFNAVLTGIALGAAARPTLRATVYALLGIVATVFVQAALTTVLAPLGIPTLTAPFVITTWLFLLAKQHLNLDQPAPKPAR